MLVNVYRPDHSNKIVISDTKLQEYLADGWVDEATYKQICEQKSAVKHQEWLTSPDTLEERFRMLRMARDAKLAEYDKHISQLDRMLRMYPNNMDYYNLRNSWDDYAITLCNLPEQPGAPWDGGGELTPWPVVPNLYAQ